MKVRDVIAGQHLVIASSEQSLGEVAQLMKTHHVTGVPIVDQWGVLAGLVTASTLLELARAATTAHHGLPAEAHWSPSQKTSPSALDWQSIPARNGMVSDLVTVDLDDDVRDAARAMVNRSVHRAIVLGKDRNVKGVLSSLDFTLLVAEGKLHE